MEEGARLLRAADMPHELVALLRGAGAHRRALDLLGEHGRGPEDHPLHGPGPTAEYLRRLGGEAAAEAAAGGGGAAAAGELEALVFEYSRCVCVCVCMCARARAQTCAR